ncbi:DNA cytosine methyltransferase [Pseudoalteromonas sp. BDTF-M6]|uniref:DNA cytosine methyltransferase n=1 Tax=Pseudoalteromonas sp. BDTF-M6 TaxID=2796132 RepID=UPI001BAF3961|nr:DNA cytosine methyltransferase [Pseudoalteromonas sp. BDTF-M6]MBS3798539.1 DNA cytosine methyltransferase [Pseudoalteromonas sp. BDTF-M6]
MSNPILFSFFSGSGFLDLGFETSGFNVAFVNEYHTPFLEAYKYSRDQMGIPAPQFGYSNLSIEEFLSGPQGDEFSSMVEVARQSGSLVGFIGGPPCPDFSVGGKNKGKDGENGKLTKTYVELILKDQPDYFIFENVKGLWRTKRHREFYDEMKERLVADGYIITDRLTNAIEYGAPQDRDRILMFGIKSNKVNSRVDGNSLEDCFDWMSNIVVDREAVLKKGTWPEEEPFREGSVTDFSAYIAPELKPLTVQYWFDKNDVDSHPNATKYFQPKSNKFGLIKEGDDSKKSFKRLHRWRYSPTAAYGNNEVHLHPYKARRLSAAEALAIQSLPANFHFPQKMTLSDMFKTIGNGVPFLVSLGLAKTVAKFLNSYAD